ncbi:hypothetical protein N7548_00090 [Acholeplasma manati]|uniref:Uncharacterized protein n=1 Tax=Paracholeplasma manati TaxID=591373 RepID=A0ABT2Y3B7_9MOLU|nr:hypothetical protein [Paracholeplasma manati]MCV2231224.1 hypothetical protein [Paracholeplasma manati]
MKFQVLTISVVIDHDLFHDYNQYENKDFKNSLVKKLLDKIATQKKLQIKGRKKTYVLYSEKDITNDIVMFKLGKRSITELHVEMDDDIESTKIEDTPFVLGFISLSKQAILVGMDNKIINKDTIINILEEGLNSVQKDNVVSYDFKISPLKETQYFWDLVEHNSDSIKEIQLDFYPPNFIGYSKQIKEQLKATKEETNNSKLSLIYKNENGFLKVKQDFFGDMVEYTNTSGEWRLVVIKDSKKRTYQSKNAGSSKVIEKNVVDFFSENMTNNEISINEKNKYISRIVEIVEHIYDKENN